MSTFGELEIRGFTIDGKAITIDGPLTVNGGIFGGAGRGKLWFVDPLNGDDGSNGKTPRTALKTLLVAYNKTTANQHDTVVLIGSNSGASIVDTLIWANNYTHLIGISAPTPNARSRISNSGATTANKALLEVTATGCVFKNFRLGQFDDEATCGALEVSGNRNYFENVDIQGQAHATPGADANAYSLFLNGAEECRFDRCLIGIDTIVRTDGSVLRVDGSAARNEFFKCHFKSYSETVAARLVKYVDTAALDRYTLFDECRFSNFSVNHAVTLTECFDIPAAPSTHDIYLEDCKLYGIDEWATSDRGTIFVTGSIPAAGTAGTGSSGKAIEPS